MSSKTSPTATKKEARSSLLPKVRFPEFWGEESWPGNKLAELCDLNKGEQLAAFDKDAGGRYPHYNGGISPSSYTGRANREANTIIISEGGNSCGYVQFVTEPFWSGGHNYSLAVKSNLNTLYLFYALQAKQREIMALRIGSGLPNIQKSTLGQFEVFLPQQSAEQQKIAECLSSVDELMAAQARKVDALKTHKKGLMQQLFPREGETQPRLRFSEFQNAGEWSERKLGTVCDIQRGKFSHRPRNDPRFFGGQYPFIQTGDVVKSGGGAVIASQSLNEEGLAVSKLFKPTIVLVTIAANIGDTGLLQTAGCFTDSVVGLIPKKDAIPVFLELIMRGQKVYLNKVATTGAQKNINNEILREVSVLLPSVPEQERIADCLSGLDALISAGTQKLEALKLHKKGLMQKLFPTREEVDA